MASDIEPIVSSSDLAAVGIEDTESAHRALESLAGHGITDETLLPFIPILLNALHRSPDADRSLSCFTRWFTALPTPLSHLSRIIAAPRSLESFCQVTGCSQYFGDLIIQNPEYYSVIEEPDSHAGSHSTSYFYRQVSALVSICSQTELKRDALRRWKAREMMRIGVRDLTGVADMPVTSREFSHLADSCVQAAYDIAVESLPLTNGEALPGFAVIGMGKLGGLELNYSSDIDLMFVHADQLAEIIQLENGRKMETATYLTRLAEAIIRILTDETSSGSVFRVDMRLRPEGRFGSLTRSLSGFEEYYESWAESWEFQALLKARPIAGDRTVAHKFMTLISRYVYREYPSAKLMEELRLNKRRIEEKCEIEGETETNVKTGYGGIRDVEFTIQSLQLQHGYRHRRVRTTNSLSAIYRLYRTHLISQPDRHILTDGYVFLRNLEHRLQLLNGFQVQNLPGKVNTHERNRVARRMGYADLTEFETDLIRHRDQIHQVKERILFSQDSAAAHRNSDAQGTWHELGNLLDNLNTPTARERLSALLVNQGFADIPLAFQALHLAMSGNEFGEMPPDTPIEFKRIAAELLVRAARSSSPDAALAGIEALATAVPNRAQLYSAFNNSPDLLDRLIRLAAGSPPLLKRLATHLEWMEAVLSPDTIPTDETSGPDSARTAYSGIHGPSYDRILSEMQQRRKHISSADKAIDAVSAVFQREALLIGARELWEDIDATGVARSLTGLADATIQALIEFCAENMIANSPGKYEVERSLKSIAVVGLGKLGGEELGYASDWDLLVVHDPHFTGSDALSESELARIAEELVSRLTDAAQELILRGAYIEIDLRLRPWGRSGSLAPSLQSYIEYYRTSAEMWERQAAIKARFVAGNRRVGERLVRVLHAVSFGHSLSPLEDSEVLAMKKRIELERLNIDQRFTDVKLGYGGLIDIEWIAQRLQLQNGVQYRSLRVSNTVQSLSELAACGLLDNTEADVLIECYNLLARVRNALWLQIGHSQDTLPADLALRKTVARQLGYGSTYRNTADERMLLDVTSHMSEARAIFVRRFNTPAI